jgi:PEP-CTERM motif-containing protein
MRTFSVLLAVAAVTGFTSPAIAATTISFGTPSGSLGYSHTYSADGFSVTASGFNASDDPTSLYGKNSGGDEVGLGLKNDPSGDHEIYFGKGYVQIDVSALLGRVSDISFFTNSTTQGEQWSIFGSNSSGTYSGLALLKGTNESSANLPSLGGYKFYDFVSTSRSGGKNFLLGGLTMTAAVPEPATWALLLLGFGGVGGMMRRKRRQQGVAVSFA